MRRRRREDLHAKTQRCKGFLAVGLQLVGNQWSESRLERLLLVLMEVLIQDRIDEAYASPVVAASLPLHIITS
jgi:hypothetical protein